MNPVRQAARDRTRSLAEILDRADSLPENEGGLAAGTINRHFDHVDLILEFAASEGHKTDKTMSVQFLRPRKVVRDRDQREAFHPAVLEKLFHHPIWTGCLSVERRHRPGKKIIKDGLYWAPLIAAYSGARREDICGLAVDDIEVFNGLPRCIIRKNAYRGFKNLVSERILPIHSQLISLGFLRYVEEQRRMNSGGLFPELKPTNATDSFGDNIFYNWDRALDAYVGRQPS